MIGTNTSIYQKAYNPFLQGGIVLVASMLVMGLSKMIHSVGISNISPAFYWQITASFMLFFAVFNSVFSLSTQDINKYWIRSMMSFVLMVGGSTLAAYICSGQSIGEAGPYKAIFIVLTFGYLVFLSIMNFMKTIVNYAEREDWQAPKKRKK
jgi:hypothetical protein